MADPDYFHEPFFQFSIRKPESWRFVPPAWSPAALFANHLENANDWSVLPSQPFVCFMRDHSSATEVYPTVQVVARRCAVPSVEQATALVQQQIGLMTGMFADFEPLTVSASSLIAGKRATSLRARYTLIAGEDEELSFVVIARSYVIFAGGFAFTVGMTSSDDPRYFDESEFEAVLRSINIGKARV